MAADPTANRQIRGQHDDMVRVLCGQGSSWVFGSSEAKAANVQGVWVVDPTHQEVLVMREGFNDTCF